MFLGTIKSVFVLSPSLGPWRARRVDSVDVDSRVCFVGLNSDLLTCDSKTALLDHHSCVKCPAGTFSASDAATECIDCASGTHTDLSGSIKCTACANNQYSESYFLPQDFRTDVVVQGVDEVGLHLEKFKCTICSSVTQNFYDGLFESNIDDCLRNAGDNWIVMSTSYIDRARAPVLTMRSVAFTDSRNFDAQQSSSTAAGVQWNENKTKWLYQKANKLAVTTGAEDLTLSWPAVISAEMDESSDMLSWKIVADGGSMDNEAIVGTIGHRRLKAPFNDAFNLEIEDAQRAMHICPRYQPEVFALTQCLDCPEGTFSPAGSAKRDCVPCSVQISSDSRCPYLEEMQQLDVSGCLIFLWGLAPCCIHRVFAQESPTIAAESS